MKGISRRDGLPGDLLRVGGGELAADLPVGGLAGLPLVGGDIVEVAPPFDGPGQITALLAANLMFEFLCVLARTPGPKGPGLQATRM